MIPSNDRNFLSSVGEGNVPLRSYAHYLSAYELFAASARLTVSSTVPEISIAHKPSFVKQAEHPPCADAVSFFNQEGYRICPARCIANRNMSTILTSAGVQILEEVVHAESCPPIGRLFVAQPVIRSQFMDQIAPGNLSAFVNFAALQVNPSATDHFIIAKDWLNFLRVNGVGHDIHLTPSPPLRCEWGGKQHFNCSINVVVNDVEVGEFNYITGIAQNRRPPLDLSDCGFGLERLLWSQRKEDFYSLLPGAECAQHAGYSLTTFDHLRAFVLLATSGVAPANSEAGYRLKKYGKSLKAAGIVPGPLFEDAASAVYEGWSTWTKLSMPLHEFLRIFRDRYFREF